MNKEQHQNFHNDLRAAIDVGVPLEFKTASRDKLSKSKLEKLETELLLCTDYSKESLPQNLFDRLADSKLPQRYVAALNFFHRTGKMVPVIEGLSVRAVHQQKARRVLWYSLMYLALLALVAASGLALFITFVFPNFEEIDLSHSIDASVAPPEGLGIIEWVPAAVTAVAIVLGVLCVWILLLGGAKVLTRWLGGAKYLESATKAELIPAVRLLMESGLSSSESINAACDLFDADQKLRASIQQLVANQKDTTLMSSAASYFRTTADQQIFTMRTATRVALVTLVGGAIALCYGLAIYSPLVDLLYKLVGTPS